MPCYKPLRAWHREPRIGFKPFRGARKISLPCQRCIGCKLDHSKDWATRCAHEATLHRYNSFLTLTVDDDHLKDRYWTGLRNDQGAKVYGGNLDHREIQLFLKKLRDHISRGSNKIAWQERSSKPGRPALNGNIKYYMCGEYGEKYRRPHYHVCLFGADFRDKKYFTQTPAGSQSYVSQTLNEIWGNGKAYIGELNWQSAAYAARYCLKKITGDPAPNHYTVVCADTGEIIRLQPEYAKMSRGNRLKKDNAIGKEWLDKYMPDVYPHGYVILRSGKKTTTPKYYDKQFKKENENEYKLMKEKRAKAMDMQFDEQSSRRLETKRIIAERAIKALQQKF